MSLINHARWIAGTISKELSDYPSTVCARKLTFALMVTLDRAEEEAHSERGAAEYLASALEAAQRATESRRRVAGRADRLGHLVGPALTYGKRPFPGKSRGGAPAGTV